MGNKNSFSHKSQEVHNINEVFDLERETEFYQFILNEWNLPTKLREPYTSCMVSETHQKKIKWIQRRNEVAVKVALNFYHKYPKNITQIQRDLTNLANKFEESRNDNDQKNATLLLNFQSKMIKKINSLNRHKGIDEIMFFRDESKYSNVGFNSDNKLGFAQDQNSINSTSSETFQSDQTMSDDSIAQKYTNIGVMKPSQHQQPHSNNEQLANNDIDYNKIQKEMLQNIMKNSIHNDKQKDMVADESDQTQNGTSNEHQSLNPTKEHPPSPAGFPNSHN